MKLKGRRVEFTFHGNQGRDMVVDMVAMLATDWDRLSWSKDSRWLSHRFCRGRFVYALSIKEQKSNNRASQAEAPNPKSAPSPRPASHGILDLLKARGMFSAN